MGASFGVPIKKGVVKAIGAATPVKRAEIEEVLRVPKLALGLRK